MGLSIFIIGFIIFVIYVYFLVYNVFFSTKKQSEENNISQKVDNIDNDGMGNFSRFGN